MTKKDFNAIAEILNRELLNTDGNQRDIVKRISFGLGTYLKSTNTRFDLDRFLKRVFEKRRL